VAFAEIEKFIDTPVKHYSSGMYVRLAFAVAAHLEPEILLVDEVLAVGDAAFQKKCLGKMGDVAKEGRTVLFVSHNMAAVRALCSRAVLLQSGRRIHDGSPTTVISQYFQTLSLGASNRRLQFEATDSKAQIREIKLATDLAPDNTIDYTSPISFEVNCEVKEPSSGIYMGINIYNGHEERLIFWRDIELLPELWGPREAGTYTYRITIPGHVLSPGLYRLDIALVELLGSKLLHWPQEFLTFEVADHHSVRRAKNLPWKGLTSIPLDLNVTYHPYE
jgi:lipopolysaccharide transport system ATP-binding protein